SAPMSRNARARSSSFRTIARTALPCFNSNPVTVRPIPPTRPAAPVTKMGFAILVPLIRASRKTRDSKVVRIYLYVGRQSYAAAEGKVNEVEGEKHGRRKEDRPLSI